jgi:hypothetical protein
MIRPNELRKGNWLNQGEDNDDLRPIKVFSVMYENVFYQELDIYEDPAIEDLMNCSPIYLTPEILIKAGFINPEKRIFTYHANHGKLGVKSPEHCFFCLYTRSCISIRPVYASICI